MDDRDILRQERLERIRIFGDDNHDDWPADSLAAQEYAEIDAILTDLGPAKIGQIRAPVGKSTLLDALLLDQKAISRTARGIALKEPGFAAPYRLPVDGNESDLKTHCDSLLKLLEDNPKPIAEGGDTPAEKTAKAALRKKFTDRLMPVDFVATLRADRDALDMKNEDKTSDNLEGVKSTKDIETLLARGSVASVSLDGMMQNLYAREAGKLRAWLAASRVERTAKKKKPDSGDGTAGAIPAKP